MLVCLKLIGFRRELLLGLKKPKKETKEHQEIAEYAKREVEKAQQDTEEAKIAAEKAKQEAEQAKYITKQFKLQAEEAKNVAEHAKQDAKQVMKEAEQAKIEESKTKHQSKKAKSFSKNNIKETEKFFDRPTSKNIKKVIKKSNQNNKAIPILEYEFKCDECDTKFKNELSFEKHYTKKYCMCDSCMPCNCADSSF